MPINLPPLDWHTGAAPAIASVESLGAGDFCVCYLVNQTQVVRIARHAQASAALRREMLLLPDLAGHLDVRIPQIQGAGVRRDSGEQFIAYPLVPGTILEPEAIAPLGAACCSALVGQMAGFLAQLHRFPLETARSYGLTERDPRRYLPALFDRARAGIADRLSAEIWRYYHQLVARYLATPELQTYAPALLHGDLSPGHFLGDPERCLLTGVIDFGDSCIGDPYWDLIFILEDYGQAIFDSFLACYAPAAASQAAKRVRIFQQLANLEYCLSMLSDGDPAAVDEALGVLAAQATAQPITGIL